MIWRICAIVTEQSHVLKCRIFCIFISKVMSGFCVLSNCQLAVFCVATVVLIPFVAFGSNRILTKIKREAILPQDTDFSVSCGSRASLFIVVRIGFEPCNNHYLAGFVLPGPLFAFVARRCVTYHGYFSLDPFFSIVASLKALQCLNLRAKGRFSYGCVFVIAPLRSVTVRFEFLLRELSIFLLCFDYTLARLITEAILLCCFGQGLLRVLQPLVNSVAF